MTSEHIALRKASEMALEALERHYMIDGAMDISNEKKGTTFAIAALREALAQSEQEPVARLLYWHGPAHYPIPHDGVAARTFSEFSKETADDPDSYWKNGEPLYLHPAQIPEGWQLVPKEPTDEMINAAEEVRQYELSTHWRRWAAMLAAAPKPEE